MTFDIGDFDGIVSASYSMDERELLRAEGEMYDHIYPQAKNWAFDNAPGYLFEKETPFIELADQIGFGIEGYTDMHFASKFPWLVPDPGPKLTGRAE